MSRAARPILVIGYGNTLRGDDALGPVVAAAVAEKARPNVLVVTVTQLTPELAEPLAASHAAVFIDARHEPDSGVITVEPLRPADVSLPTHTADPRCLLTLARALFGHAPPAWLVSVAGADFGLRESLSPEGRRHAAEAVKHVEGLLRELEANAVFA